MVTQEQNSILTQTGPNTAMGNVYRRYWIPALLSEEIPEADCPPVRVKLLSERLVAFRDTDGKVGLMDEFCAHRRVSLWFGRNEERGLRCPYHGWKYDVRGVPADLPALWWPHAHHRLHYVQRRHSQDSGSHRRRQPSSAHYPGTRATAVG